MKLSDSQLLLLTKIHFKANIAYIRDIPVSKQIINNNLPTLKEYGLIVIGGSYNLKLAKITEEGKQYLANM